jgi:hypothetical protein
MKIQNPYGIGPEGGIKRGAEGRRPEGGAGSFSDLLDGIRKGATPNAASGAQATAHTTGPSKAAGSAAITQVQQAALARGEELLGLLDRLSALLEETKVPDKALDSLAAGLSQKVQEVQESKLRLDGQDPLRQTLDEIQVLSQVEYMKIVRGDYSS